jgi:uncharacterized heparinase superfamily protein
MIEDKEQSEVWGGFRVANRAKIIDLKETADTITTAHDGYRSIGAIHTRTFIFDHHHISIQDSIASSKNHTCIAFLHCHPDVTVRIDDAEIVLDGGVIITCNNFDTISTEIYHYAPEFNTLIPATVIKITFTKNLTMDIAL